MKVVEIVRKFSRTQWLCVLFIDDVSDIESVTDIQGLPRGFTLASGSLVYDKNFAVGVLDDQGEWVFKDE